MVRDGANYLPGRYKRYMMKHKKAFILGSELEQSRLPASVYSFRKYASSSHDRHLDPAREDFHSRVRRRGAEPEARQGDGHSPG